MVAIADDSAKWDTRMRAAMKALLEMARSEKVGPFANVSEGIRLRLISFFARASTGITFRVQEGDAEAIFITVDHITSGDAYTSSLNSFVHDVIVQLMILYCRVVIGKARDEAIESHSSFARAVELRPKLAKVEDVIIDERTVWGDDGRAQLTIQLTSRLDENEELGMWVAFSELRKIAYMACGLAAESGDNIASFRHCVYLNWFVQDGFLFRRSRQSDEAEKSAARDTIVSGAKLVRALIPAGDPDVVRRRLITMGALARTQANGGYTTYVPTDRVFAPQPRQASLMPTVFPYSPIGLYALLRVPISSFSITSTPAFSMPSSSIKFTKVKIAGSDRASTGIESDTYAGQNDPIRAKRAAEAAARLQVIVPNAPRAVEDFGRVLYWKHGDNARYTAAVEEVESDDKYMEPQVVELAAGRRPLRISMGSRIAVVPSGTHVVTTIITPADLTICVNDAHVIFRRKATSVVVAPSIYVLIGDYLGLAYEEPSDIPTAPSMPPIRLDRYGFTALTRDAERILGRNWTERSQELALLLEVVGYDAAAARRIVQEAADYLEIHHHQDGLRASITPTNEEVNYNWTQFRGIVDAYVSLEIPNRKKWHTDYFARLICACVANGMYMALQTLTGGTGWRLQFSFPLPGVGAG
jgi:hypothetical protein